MKPERWLRLSVDLTDNRANQVESADGELGVDIAHTLAQTLVELGSSGVQEEDGCCITYFAEPGDPAAFRRSTEARLATDIGPNLGFEWTWQDHEEWAELWRQGFVSHEIGERLRITPPWITRPEEDGRAEVVIDPGVAFGTAEHGSTRSCLTLLESHVGGGESILDVGAGSGVLAIAALKLGAEFATCVEIDEMACHALTENAERNAVADRVAVHCAPFAAQVAPGRYDIVVCNMVRARSVPLLGELARRVQATGCLVLGGIQASERAEILSDVAKLGDGWSRPALTEDEGWLALLSRRTPVSV